MAQFFQLDVDSIQNLSEELQTTTNTFDAAAQGVQYFVQAAGSNESHHHHQQQQFVIINNTVQTPLIDPFNTHLQPVYYLESPTKAISNEMQSVPVVLNHLQQKVVMGTTSTSTQSVQQQIMVAQSPSATRAPRAPITTVAGIQRAQLSSTPELLNNRIRSPRPILTDPTARPKPSPMHSNAAKRQNGGGLVKTEDGKEMQMSEYQKFMEQKRSEKRAQLLHQRGAQMLQAIRKSDEAAAEPKRSGRIIQPNANMRLPSVLRNFVPPPEIKDLVNRTTDNAEFENSIRMFVMLECGEQRLITFTTPKEDCTIQEILDQVGVPLEPNTYIAVSEINNHGINLVVSVGFEPDFDEEPSKENQAEPQSKFIPGKMAVCEYCGYLSEDFIKCVRCRIKLPTDVRSVATPDAKKKPQISINLKSNVNTLSSPASSVNKSTGSAAPMSTLLNKGVRKKVTTAKKPIDDPVIVTLSSDDDNDNDEQSSDGKSNGGEKSQVADKEPTIDELKSVIVLPSRKTTAMACTSIACRTIRIGSYRFSPAHDVTFNSKELTLRAPHIQRPESTLCINIPRKWMMKVLVHFQKTMPLIICYLLPLGAEKICSTLGMSRDGTEGYFDPVSSDETERRLVLLPTSLGEEDKWVLNTIYDDPCVIEELTYAEANAILMKTCPKDATIVFNSSQPTSTGSGDVKRLFIYPPGKGGIAINTEDYMCLERDQFLNDVIIDFYLKYFMNQLPHEQQSKVHVFSTFFYNRLTTKSARLPRRTVNEPEVVLTAAQKRHLRVKNWTKNVDLFNKDFIIVPINENAHWFLAIICFPGLQGAKTLDGKETTVTHHKRTKRSTNSAAPVKNEALPQIENDSDKDEAEGDESEFDVEDTDEASVATKIEDEDVAIKQPCILIFDSLGGTSRARVVATLRDYLTCEHAAKKSTIRVFNKDTIRGSCPKIPQQNNYTDCGLYVLQYVESFFQKPIDDYRIPIAGLKEWFDEIVVTRKREDITKLIRELMNSYNRDVSLLPNITLPTENGVPIEAPPDEEMERDEEGQLTTPKLTRSDSNTSSSTIPLGPASNNNSDNELAPAAAASSTSSPSRETAMSYLRAKRIIKQKAEPHADTPKKAKLEDC